MRTFHVTPDRRLDRPIEVEARLAGIPPDYTIKGIFCQSLVNLLDRDWSAVRDQLLAPPPSGRYDPFGDYPQHDYSRIALAAARRLFPDDPLAEAARLLGRQDLMFFASGPMGRTLFDPGASLWSVFARLPELYAMVIRGGSIRSEPRGDRCVHLSFDDYHGWVDSYTVGTIEGIVMHYDHRPMIQVTVPSTVDADYLVCW